MNEWLWTIVIVLVVLLLFGAKRIPEVMRSLGQGVKEFKKAAREISETNEQQHTEKTPNSASSESAKKESDKKV